MDYELSDTDLKQLVPNMNIVVYNNISQYSNIDEVLNGKPTIILFEMVENNAGHWCTLFKEKGTVYFFDSYGVDIEQQKKYMSKRMLKKANYLSILLKRCPYKLDVNRTKYQEMKPGTNSCGRWCVIRIWNKNLNDSQFKDYIDKLCSENNCSPDELTVLLTQEQLGK